MKNQIQKKNTNISNSLTTSAFQIDESLWVELHTSIFLLNFLKYDKYFNLIMDQG